ncbi:sugar phosphate isomerase/epimerase family protein [Maribacter sp. 2-571]|uniref:sugar phosphate isomerase/epimerase family protein n=1 Tax=Maribacter sp. 2-571 TaxID=3417569 RepID=UPI003D32E60E
MTTRRSFIKRSGTAAIGALVLPTMGCSAPSPAFGVQLYSFRDALAKDAIKTLEGIAGLGIKKIESARSDKGLYYGLRPEQMGEVCADLGMQLISGHVHLDDTFENTMEQAAASGQEYVICSSLPTNGQHIDNYKSVAEAFNKAGEACKKMGLKFGYHNHEYEFESDKGTVLYDILMDETVPELVHMELDLGWVIVAKKDPLHYFEKYPGRFPLWHLKDMNLANNESTEFGKGALDIKKMMQYQKQSGVDHIFIEQEEYASTPMESMQHNMDFLKQL